MTGVSFNLGKQVKVVQGVETPDAVALLLPPLSAVEVAGMVLAVSASGLSADMTADEST